MIFDLAWKNIWRNKLRSSIIISAITVGLVGGIFSLAFSNGMLMQMINATINSETADLQIHNKDFKTNYDLNKYIPNSEKLTSEIKTISDVKSVSKRVVISGMANSASNGIGVMITGVIPPDEKNVSNIHSKIIKGKYFSSKRNSAVVGSMLLKKLNIKLNSKIILTFQDFKGEITTAAFRIVGVYQTSNSQFDQNTVFVNENDLRSEASLPSNYINEIAIRINSEDNLGQVKTEIVKLIVQSTKFKNLEVETWNELKPSLKIMQNYIGQFTFIFILIILIALSFGVINTMLMAIMERTHEIGMLLAIGMRRSKVFLMIMYETVMLSLVGAVLGVALAFLLNLVTGRTGIDLSVFSDGFRAYGYNPIVVPQMEAGFYYLILLMVFVVSMLASIYPATKAIKLKPAVAIRHIA